MNHSKGLNKITNQNKNRNQEKQKKKKQKTHLYNDSVFNRRS